MNKREQLKTDLRIAKELQAEIDRVSAELSAVNESNHVAGDTISDLSREVVTMKEVKK